MMKIILDIFLILLFIGVGALQCYVIYRIRDLKGNYEGFINSQDKFSRSIEQARQSLMMLSSQNEHSLPELKNRIEESKTLLQDFSFVIARANKKIDLLEGLSSHTLSGSVDQSHESELNKKPSFNVQLNSIHKTHKQENEIETNNIVENDPLLARLEKQEKQESTNSMNNFNILETKKPTMTSHQQEMIDKALKEIL